MEAEKLTEFVVKATADCMEKCYKKQRDMIDNLILKELKPYSPLVISLLQKAYKKTLAKDKNGETKLTYRNLTFFMIIANGELEANFLSFKQSIL